jgi:type I restriction enzyme S subunit
MKYEIPENWKWYRLGDVVFFQEGPGIRNWQFKTHGIKLLNVKNILSNGDLLLENSDKFVSEEEFNEKYKHFLIEEGDLLFASSGGSWGKSAWFKNPGYKVMMNTSTIRLRFYSEKFEPNYLKYYLDSSFFRNQMEPQLVGMQPNFGSTHLSRIYIPIPPLAEQKHIVSKVDELMALCEKLETRRQKKQKLQSKLNSAALDRMLSAENQEEFEQHWQRICENFDLLYDNPENVEKLKQAILQLAVQGKLVPQNPEDEPASVLIEKIDSERARLVKKGEIKRNKPLPIEFDKIPYDLPETWRWVRIDEVARNVEYGTSEKASEIEDGVPILRMNNVQNGKIDYEDLKYVPESIKDLPRLFLKHDDLLFNRTNSYELVGKTGIFKGEDDTFTFASYLIRVSLFNEYIVPDFINMSLNSSYFRKTQIEPEITQQCGQANFNGTKLKNSLVPLPPLPEQKRIVEKVEQLMGLCDELEAKLRKEKEDSEKLMEAVVKGLLEDAVAENTELEKPIPLQAAVVKLK